MIQLPFYMVILAHYDQYTGNHRKRKGALYDAYREGAHDR